MQKNRSPDKLGSKLDVCYRATLRHRSNSAYNKLNPQENKELRTLPETRELE